MRRLTIIILLHFANNIYSQAIFGVIKDFDTKKPIAFVNLKIPNSRQGASTDIDGNFSLKMPEDYKGIVIISHVGYEKLRINRDQLGNEVLLHAKTTNLNELLFVADENPAHNIIRKTVANRKKHDPNRLRSYRYKSYSKQIWKLDGDDRLVDSLLNLLQQNDTLQLTKKDSVILKTDAFAKQQHLFITESVTEKKFLSPGMVNERLLAINTSGFKSPLFATTGTDYQPLGFYDEVITIFDKSHTNPIAEGTLRRYDFYLEDTTYYQQDTVFVLRFNPRKGKKFEGLHGQISISKNGYAIRNVIASTADPLSKTDIKIQQIYDCFNGVWFPTQLNTDIIFKEYIINERKAMIASKSYFSEIELNKELAKTEFSDVSLELLDIDDSINAKVLSMNRYQKLDSIEQKTFMVWDTLGHKLNKISNMIEYLSSGKIPIGKIDLRIDKFFQFNQHEKTRLGVGAYTGRKFSKSMQLGAYIGYGFGDEVWKYEGSLKFNLYERTATNLTFSYAKDLIELGRVNYFDNAKVLNKQLLRSIEGNKFNFYEAFKISMNSRIAPFTYGQLSLEKTTSVPTYDYSYVKNDFTSSNSFDFTELSVSIRYVKKEKYLNLKGNKILLGYEYPIFILNYTHGISDLFNSDFDYNKVNLLIDFEKKSRFGHTKIYLNSAFVNGDVPINKLITGQGNNTSNFVVPHYFQTMGLYEFISDKEISVFFNHNFGNILLNTKFVKPELVIYQNTAIGDISNPQRHQDIIFDTLEKGYFESGVGLKNLIRINYVNLGYAGFGADVFYRYGAYAFTKTSDNFAVRFNFDFTF